MKKLFDVSRAAAHVAQIADQHGIEISNHSSGGRAWRRLQKIKIRPIKSAVTYAIALHELGHVLGEQRGRRRVEKEVQAWEWAEANALFWTKIMSEKKRKCLRTYIVWAERKQKRLGGVAGVVFIEPNSAIYRQAEMPTDSLKHRSRT